MNFTFFTLFPEMIECYKNHSIIKRSIEKELINIDIVNYRDYSKNKHKKVDDTPYGGSAGMLLTVQPIYDALQAHKKANTKVVLVCPTGKLFKQPDAHKLALEEDLIFICGHYEGYDERIRSYVDFEYSIGDYVITSGELAAMVMVDAVARLKDDVIRKDSHEGDSFQNGLLEHPQYTKPREFDNQKVPEVLFGGHHAKIMEYNLEQSIIKTSLKRPELLDNPDLDEEIKKKIKELRAKKII